MQRRQSFWIISVATALLVAVGVRLGFWQLDRAAQKIAYVEAVADQAARPALDNRGVRALKHDQMDAIHRPVRLTGQWLARHTVYLDNRQMGGKVGYYVIAPLQLTGLDGQPSNQVIAVQRGWAPRDFLNREQLPPVTTPVGLLEVTGRLAPPPSQLYSWAEAETGPVRQNLDWDRYREEIGLTLLPFSVVELGEPGDGLRREWPQVDAKIHTHYGYAAQWFALSLLIAGLYIWFQWIAPYRVKK
jgi:surfeit locus 1 family protein